MRPTAPSLDLLELWNPNLHFKSYLFPITIMGWHRRLMVSHTLPTIDGTVGGQKWNPQTSQPLQPQGLQSVDGWACVSSQLSPGNEIIFIRKETVFTGRKRWLVGSVFLLEKNLIPNTKKGESESFDRNDNEEAMKPLLNNNFKKLLKAYTFPWK